MRGLKVIRVAGMLFFVSVFMYSAYKLVHKTYDYYHNDRLYSELREKYSPALNHANAEPVRWKSRAVRNEPTEMMAESLEETRQLKPVFKLSEREKYQIAEQEKAMAAIEEQKRLETNMFEHSPELLELNSDIVGWIKIPHTNIDYPIVQRDDNDYYLTRDFTKKTNSGGSIFMDYRNDSGWTDTNTILYGHNMKNKSMFHDVVEYKQKQFFDEHPLIYTYSPEGVQKWEVFLVYVSDVSFDYLITDFSSEKEFQQYISALWRKAYHTRNIELNSKDKILTLSTCSYEFDDARTVLNARLVE